MFMRVGERRTRLKTKFPKPDLLQYACDVGMSQRRRLFENVERQMTSTTIGVPQGYVYLAMTANFWGMAKNTKDALRNVRGAGGSQSLKRHGYIIYAVHPDTEINEIDGSFLHPRGCAPVKLQEHRVKA